MHVAIGDYVVEHLGDRRHDEADRLRQKYWLRYGATLLGLVRHHGVRAAHFLDETHRLPGLEERLRTSAHDRAALRGCAGASSSSPTRRAPTRCACSTTLRPAAPLRRRHHDRGHDDVRRAPAQARRAHAAPRRGAPRVAPSRCVLVEDTLVHLKAARSIGMRTVWMQRYLGGRFRGTLRDPLNGGFRTAADSASRLPEARPTCMPKSARSGT